MKQMIFKPSYSPASATTERELFTLRPSILAIWPVFVAIPMAALFACSSYIMGCDIYDHWFSIPEGARDIAWRLASDENRNGFRMNILVLLGLIVGVICLIVYIAYSFKAWKEKEIVLTASQIIYTVKNTTKVYSINQIVSYIGDTGHFFRDVSYKLNTNEIISVEYVKASAVESANNYIDNYIHNKR